MQLRINFKVLFILSLASILGKYAQMNILTTWLALTSQVLSKMTFGVVPKGAQNKFLAIMYFILFLIWSIF